MLKQKQSLLNPRSSWTTQCMASSGKRGKKNTRTHSHLLSYLFQQTLREILSLSLFLPLGSGCAGEPEPRDAAQAGGQRSRVVQHRLLPAEPAAAGRGLACHRGRCWRRWVGVTKSFLTCCILKHCSRTVALIQVIMEIKLQQLPPSPHTQTCREEWPELVIY